MNDEIPIMRRCWLALSGMSTMFRCNAGQAWIGSGKPVRRSDGSVTIPFARSIALGLSLPDGKSVVGVGDLLGWSSVTITPEMVGSKLAIFTSIEVKNSDGGKHSKEQINWGQNVTHAGGIFGFASSPEDAQKIISDYMKKISDNS